jgi:Family of unknown function (DUF6152)
MTLTRVLVLCAVAGLVPVNDALAHHSFAAEYDATKTITLKGTVTKIEWTNPHVRFYVDVRDEKGAVVNWDLELQSVNTLTRAGWNRNSLKVGDVITVTAWLARDGSHRGNARENITLADGRQIFAGERPRPDGEEVKR